MPEEKERLTLDTLNSTHLENGTYAAFLEGKLIQSDGPPPPFVDPSWVSEPDVVWTLGHNVMPPTPKRKYRFADERNIPDITREEWLEAIRGSKVRKERKAVAEALTQFGDYATGKRVRPAMATIADQLGRTRENVTRCVRKLVTEGWLTATGKGPKGVMIYALTVPQTVTQSVTECDDAKSVTQYVTN